MLGLDVGQARIGIARGSTMARIAEPLAVVDTDQATADISDIIKEHQVDGIVVGLPRGLNGQETDQTKWVRQWAEELKSVIDTPLYWQDEALTTKLAEELSSKKSHGADAEAAAIILQDWLDTPEAERVAW